MSSERTLRDGEDAGHRPGENGRALRLMQRLPHGLPDRFDGRLYESGSAARDLLANQVGLPEAIDDPADLSLRLDGPAAISVSHPRHREVGGNAREDRQTGEDRSRPPGTSAASDEHVLPAPSSEGLHDGLH